MLPVLTDTNSNEPAAGATSDERGSVVLFVLVLSAALAAIGLAFLGLSSTDRAMSSNYQSGVQTLLAAESLAEHVLSVLVTRADWTPAVAGTDRSTFATGTSTVPLPWGGVLDLAALTAAVQQKTDAVWAGWPDRPVWRLFAWGPFADLVGGDRIERDAYLVAWISDNAADADADPSADRDGIVVVRAEAVAAAGLRRTVQIFVLREGADSSVTSELPTEAPSADQSDTTEVAQILPEATPGAAAEPVGSGRVRILTWREVP